MTRFHPSSFLLLLLALLVASPALAADGMAVPGPDPARFHLEAAPLLAPTVEVPREQQSMADLSVEERRAIQERLKVRRQLAEVHQVLAFTTSGLIVAAEVFGVINLVSLDKGDPPYRDLKGSLAAHRILAGASLGTYFAAGLTAWAMPPAYKANLAAQPTTGKKKVDSGDVHVALSVAHGIGMATMLATGVLMANVADNKAWEPLVATHTAVGFTTAALVFGAAIVINTL